MHLYVHLRDLKLLVERCFNLMAFLKCPPHCERKYLGNDWTNCLAYPLYWGDNRCF